MADTAQLEARLEALDEVIASGELTVSYEGKTITFRSLSELLRARSDIQRQLNGGRRPRTIYAVGENGY